MDRKNQSRPNRTECTNVDRKGFKGTELDQIRTNRQIRTKVYIMDQIGTNRTKNDQVGPNRTNVD